MSLFAGVLLQKFPPKWVIAVSMTVNVGFCVMFVLAPDFIWLMVSRVGVGASQSFLVIYSPVWVDEFAPAEYVTVMCGLSWHLVPHQ
jgi:predicted MFS family arabinose efflux permease